MSSLVGSVVVLVLRVLACKPVTVAGGVSKLVEIADGASPGFDPPSLQAARSSDS
jgi:hypothetical protein